MRGKTRSSRILFSLILGIGSFCMSFPLLYSSLGSLCSTEDFFASPWLPIPRHFYFDNYVFLFSEHADLWRWVINTLIRIGWYIAIPGTIATMVGYVLARLRFRGRDAAFMYLLSSMTMPGIVYMIPTYIMMARFPGAGGNNWAGQGGHGFVNEWPALLIPGLVNAYYIFLLRQTYFSIPVDFEEAARVDGANTLTVLRHVYLPMLKPTLTVLVIFQFVATWNDYQWPLIVSSGNPEIWTIALGVQRTMFEGATAKKMPIGFGLVDYPFSFALATVATLPVVLLFLGLQRYFIEGVQGFALKG